MSEHSEPPSKNMPRMDRRNAVQYDGDENNDVAGLLTPGRLNVHEQLIEKPALRKQQRGDVRQPKMTGTDNETGPIPAALDGWKRIHDVTNNTLTGFSDVLEVAASGGSRAFTTMAKEGSAPGESHRPLIPWRKQEIKKTTLAEERKKMFESFDLTSAEPPETPAISQAALKGTAKSQNKRKRKEDDASSESFRPMSSPRRDPYPNIHAKVVTKWEESFSSRPKTPAESVDTKPRTSVLKGTSSLDKMSVEPSKALKWGKMTIGDKAKSNKYTTKSETVKPPENQMPLTISPKYNHRKGMALQAIESKGSSPGINGATVGVSRLSPGSKPRSTMETRGVPHSLKSTILNLQKINGGGTQAAGMFPSENKRIPGGLANKYPAGNTLGGLHTKTPGLTTLHSPISPLLASKISIQSQLAEIPVNGERLRGTPPGGGTQMRPNSPAINPHPQKTSGLAKRSPKEEVGGPLSVKTVVIPALGAVPNKYNNIYIGPYSGSESDGDGKTRK